jgi:Lar family restriction alleviation protein
MSDLKPCPFCGGDDRWPPYVRKFECPWSSVPGWVVQCDNCEAMGPGDTNKEGAVNQWNERHEPPEQLEAT